MPTIAQIVAQIRTAIFGKDVRENIALGIEQTYDEITGATSACTTLSNRLVEPFNPDNPYKIGQFVSYNSDMWQFIADHTAGDAWDVGEVVNPVLGNEMYDVTEFIPRVKVTDNLSYTTNGVTFMQTEDPYVVKLYGTAAATRRVLFLNGQKTIRTTSGSFAKTLDAGVYYIQTDLTGAQNIYTVAYTYTTFSKSVNTITYTKKNNVINFTAPVMIGFTIQEGRSYGTEEEPSYLTIKILEKTAVDAVAREELEDFEDSIEATIEEIDNSIEDIEEDIGILGDTKSPGIIKQAVSNGLPYHSAAIISLNDAADNMPLNHFSVNLHEEQDVDPENPPSTTNICNITAYDGITLVSSKKNLMGGQGLIDELTRNNIPFSVTSPSNLIPIKASDLSGGKPMIKNIFKNNTQYTLILRMRRNTTSGNGNIEIMYTDGTSEIFSNPGTDLVTVVKVTAENKTVDYIRGYHSAGYTYINADLSGIFEGVLTADDFEEYEGNTKAVSWVSDIGTIARGTLIINQDGSGQLTVTHKMYTFDSAESFVYEEDGVYQGLAYIESSVSVNCINNDPSLVSNQYSLVLDTPADLDPGIRAYEYKLYIYDNFPATTEEIAALVEAHPIQIVYELATPETYNFTIGQIKTYKGNNNIWSSILEPFIAKYYADTKAYVDGRAPITAYPTSAGTYIFRTRIISGAPYYDWIEVSSASGVDF